MNELHKVRLLLLCASLCAATAAHAQSPIWAQRGFRVDQEAAAVNEEPPAPHMHADRDAGTLIIKSTNGVQVTRLSDGALLRSLGKLQGVRSINGTSVTPDGELVIVSDSLRRLQLWNIRTREVLATGPALSRPRTVRAHIDAAAGTLLLCDDKVLRLFTLPTFTQRWSHPIVTDHPASALDISPDGRLCLSLVLETLEVRDCATGATIWKRALYPELFGIRQASFADSGRLVVTYDGGDIGVWNASSGELLRTMQDRSHDPYTAMFADAMHQHVLTWIYWWPNRPPVLFGLFDSVRTPMPLTSEDQAGIYAMALTTDGQAIVAMTDDGSLRMRALADTGFGPRLLGGHAMVAGRPAVSTDSRMVATARDGRLNIFDAATGATKVTTTARLEGNNWLLPTFSPDGSRIVLVGENPGKIFLFDTNGRRLASHGREAATCAAIFTPDGATAIYASGGAVVLVDAITLAEKRRLLGHGRPVRALRITRDGATLLSGSDDGTVNVWDLASGIIRATLEVGEGGVRDIVLTKDGRYVAALGASGRVSEHSLDATVTRVVGTYGAGLEHIDITDDGNAFIVSGVSTRAIDRKSGVTLHRFVDSLDYVTDMMYATVVPGTGHVVAGGWDGDVIMWRYDDLFQPSAIESAPSTNELSISLVDRTLTVSGPGRRAMTLRLVDVLGRTALEAGVVVENSPITIDLGGIAAGTYVVALECGGGVSTSRTIRMTR